MSRTTLDFPNLKQDCEALLRQGQFTAVQKKLQKIPATQIPRHHLADLASLARRAHLWRLSLRWLHPVVRPQAHSTAREAGPRERTEYALALHKAGALREADELLISVDPSEDPRALLSRAYVRMARWDYAGAEKFLSTYNEVSSLTDYERLIGQVNWLASLVYLKDPRVEKFRSELEDQLRKGSHKLLLSNCLEISAQYAVSQSDWAQAREALQRAQDLVDEEKSLDALFIEKWKVLVSALEAKDPQKLVEFRKAALEQGHWETLRDLDYYQAVLQPDSTWASWVYFGTPHLEFRKRLEKLRAFPEQEWISRSPQAEIKVDPWFPGHQEGDLSHRCFVALLQDFYRPLRAAEAFSLLFPNEYYNPTSSPNRVHQAMTRFRKWLAELNPSFHLTENEGSYSLRIHESIQVLCRKKALSLEENEFFIKRYDSVLGDEFTAEDLARLTGQSQSTVQRMIKKAVEQGLLAKIGSGRFTTYKIVTIAS